ncbi:hypothetical protein N7492_002615 [Penicillium capsulatum]|uniref:Uncharacterized protein n=1 Tax=Penicillium capsulatum TaxID=69766 RepID=A0A9W9IIW9_9EURO|nr:hypothetical protein N7492_002615 [Penicillium capsulatum]
MNYYIEILFDNRISWLAYSKVQRHFSAARATGLYSTQRETRVPIPKVFNFDFCETDPISVRYILVEKLPRSSLRYDFHWEIWKAEALERYKNHHQLQQVIKIYN